MTHSNIKKYAHQFLPAMQEARRFFHQNPELAHEEYETQKYV